MPPEVIVRSLKAGRKSGNAELRFIMQSAPVLKGLKTSNMLFLTDAELGLLIGELRESGLHIFMLYSTNERHLVLIYREAQLKQYIQTDEVRSFLNGYGYQGADLHRCLLILKERIQFFYGVRNIFPHEIGVFLGYPLCDVLGFIKHHGERCLCSGYWKVYDHMSSTKELFFAFDQAREEAMQEWFAGKKMREIIYRNENI